MTKSSIKNSAEGISRWETPRLVDTQQEAENAEAPPSEEEVRLDAYHEGHKQGYIAGQEKAGKEIAEKLQIIDSFISALSKPFNEQSLELVEDIASLAGKIAKSLVRRELRTEPETIMALVRDTVSALNTTSQNINIHLNPKNAQIIRGIINSDSQEQSWNIIDDPLIPHSDCKVSNMDSLIDSDLETRINLIITQFLGDERNEAKS